MFKLGTLLAIAFCFTTEAHTSFESCPASCYYPKHEGRCPTQSTLTTTRWHFNPTTSKCESFQYEGCRGNANRFSTRKSCLETCGQCRDFEHVLPLSANPRCDCSFGRGPSGGGGCRIVVSPPKGWKCLCVQRTTWTCAGVALRCDQSEFCPANCFNRRCCQTGANNQPSGNCNGYASSKFSIGDSSDIQETFDLLEEGEKTVKLSDLYSDYIFLLGNTGSGKSTLVSLLARDNTQLTAKEDPPGSENYVIIDPWGQIGNSTFDSKTLFPELVVDPVNNLPLVDCPGFIDSRGMSEDIAATYFTKLVLDHAKTVKLVFVTPYSAMVSVNGRDDFPSLVDHLSEMVRELPKYVGSVALVVTKVENKFDKKTKDYIPDDIVIRNLGDLVKKNGGAYADQKMRQAQTDEEKLFAKNARAFIDAVTLTDEAGKYVRIGIFRRPDENGSLSDMPMIQKGKAYILDILKNRLNFTTKEDSDFGYTVSDKTKNQILDLAQAIIQKIQEGMKNVSTGMEEQIRSEIDGASSWQDEMEGLGSKLKLIQNAEKDLLNLTGPVEFADAYATWVEKLNLGSYTEATDQIQKYGRYLEFLGVLTQRKDFWKVIDPFVSVADLLSSSGEWFKFMFQVQEILSTSQYQVNVSLYNVADLNNWGKGGAPGIQVRTESSFAILCELLNVVPPGIVSSGWLGRLDKVLGFTLRRPGPEVKIVGGEMVVKGRYVALSQLQPDPSVVTEVKIFALQSIFIDVSWNFPGMSLTLIGQTLEAINFQQIFLNGLPNTATFPDPGKAQPGQEGLSGEAGQPGGPGGNFLAVSSTWSDLKSFGGVGVYGGKGGTGQKGGEGGDGTGGLDTPYPKDNAKTGGDWEAWYPYGNEGTDWIRIELTEAEKRLGGHQHRFRVFGGKGENGFKGGAGGKGGKGGMGGNLLIVGLQDQSQYAPPVMNGLNGTQGQGGQGGAGGVDGRNLEITWVIVTMAGDQEHWDEDVMVDSGTRGGNGDPGQDGGSEKDWKDPTPVVPRENWVFPLNQFKAFIRDSLTNDPLSYSSLLKLHEQIEESEPLNAIYTVGGLLNDYITLEQQYFPLYQSLDMGAFYESMLKRVDFVANATYSVEDKAGRKALAYIYTTGLSKLNGIRQGTDKNLIILLEEYIQNTALRNIEELKTAEKQVYINEQKTKYKADVDQGISSAHAYITNEVSPVIETQFNDLTNETKSLIDEVKELEKQAEKRKEELIQKMEALKWNSAMDTIFGGIKIIGTAASALASIFVGPEAAVVGQGIDAAVSYGEKYALDGIPPVDDLHIPKGVTDNIAEIESRIEEKKGMTAEALKDQLDKMKELTNKASEKLKELGKKMNEMEKRLTDILNNKTMTSVEGKQAVDKLHQEFKDQVKDKQDELGKEAEAGDSKSKELSWSDSRTHSRIQNRSKILENH